MDKRSTTWLRRLAKMLLAALILVFIGRQFYHDLSQADDPERTDLGRLELRPEWLALSAGLYLAALSLSACYWYRLLRAFGARPTFLRAYRAYFIGQLGKYVPGKAWALFLRGTLVQGPDAGLGLAIITAFYEVLTTMAAGALIAAIIFLTAPPSAAQLEWHPVLTGLLLLGLCGIPLLPGVFNFLTRRVTNRFAHLESSMTSMRLGLLAQGIALTGCGWGLLGLSLWAMLRGVLAEPPPLSPASLAQYCATISLAYVAGFLAIVLPSGVGVREYFLRQLLTFAGPDKAIAAAVLLLRLVWTSSELVLAAVLFMVKSGQRRLEALEPIAHRPPTDGN